MIQRKLLRFGAFKIDFTETKDVLVGLRNLGRENLISFPSYDEEVGFLMLIDICFLLSDDVFMK